VIIPFTQGIVVLPGSHGSVDPHDILSVHVTYIPEYGLDAVVVVWVQLRNNTFKEIHRCADWTEASNVAEQFVAVAETAFATGETIWFIPEAS